MAHKIVGILSLTFIAALLLIAAPVAAAAKSDCGKIDEMSPDDSRDDTITKKSYAQVYCFIGFEGDEVVIDMTATSGNLDPYLALADITGKTIFVENDNISKKNTDAHIEYTLESDGAYIILATHKGGKSGTSTGDYTLTYTSSGGGGNSNLSTISLFDDTITVSYPSTMAFRAGTSDANATLASDKTALKAKPTALKSGQYLISLDVLSYDSVQTVTDVFVKNKKFADFVKKYGKKAAPAYLALLEASLLTDATLKTFGEVTLGNLDVVKASWERDISVGTIAYAFKTDGGDFMLVTGHVGGNNSTVTKFETFMDALVKSISFN
ncbi:MAG: hypothetical protein GC179_02110 [Anaerolineaceae bacterium]|nr:hypothetical protein [Anaerolineaceae bacterium]